MLTFEVREVPAVAQSHGHREEAFTSIGGVPVVSATMSRGSAICDLCRKLVELGVPDGPWQTRSANGMAGLRGRSIHRHAEVTVSDGDKGLIHYQRYKTGEEVLAAISSRA